MKSITQDNHQMESLNQKIATFFEQYAIGKLLRTANTNKLKGIPAMQVFLLVVCTVFRQGVFLWQGCGLPVHELLPHQLASFHHVAG